MSRDPFEVLVEEMSLLREIVEGLRRSSLDKDEAMDLNEGIGYSLDKLLEIGPHLERSIGIKLDEAVTKVRATAAEASEYAIDVAMREHRTKIEEQARLYGKAAGEARQQAWRYFSGFWGWLAAATALGAFLGALVMFWIEERGHATEFGKYPGIFCSSAGGEVHTNPEGFKFCGVWIDDPDGEAK
jgi:hypothetical protein